MRPGSESPIWPVAAALVTAVGCGGDYWLGGARGHSSGGITGVSSDAGANTQVLHGDIVLTGDQTLDLPGDDAGPCRIAGGGYSIRSEGTWFGHLTIRGCTIEGLGGGSTDAISVDMSKTGFTTIENTTFGSSGAIQVTNDDDSTTTFNDNVILGDSTVPLDPSADVTTPAFSATGASTAQKLFQGNRIYRSSASFESPNWLIGGDRDADSNVIVGLRGGFILGATGLVVRGNYVHGLHLADSGDESAVSTAYGTVDTLTEHNVLRGGTWVFRSIGGEVRYNAIVDAESSAWLYQPFENTKIHHNVFLMCSPPRNELQAGIYLVNDRAAGIEVYNNTLDGGGSAMMLKGAGVAIDDGCFLSSLRSNLVFDFPLFRNDGGAAAVRPGVTESVTPPPVRLGYADYNLFFNPTVSPARNYAVSVMGLTERTSAGFGANDAHAGGPLDEQVDPGPLGFSGNCFPWSDADIEASRVTVSEVLAAMRTAYAPAPTSAALSAGDPADGTGNFIGGVGDGSLGGDLFGTFGR